MLFVSVAVLTPVGLPGFAKFPNWLAFAL